MNKIESIHVAPTSESRSVPGRFEEALRGAAAGLASGIAAGVELAAPFVPAGTVVSAAVRSAVSGATAGAVAGATGAGAAAGGGGENYLLAATRALQQQSQSANLTYLQLQESMQKENREFTTLSNIMRVKHDSAKSAIQNIH